MDHHALLYFSVRDMEPRLPNDSACSNVIDHLPWALLRQKSGSKEEAAVQPELTMIGKHLQANPPVHFEHLGEVGSQLLVGVIIANLWAVDSEWHSQTT
jgi:hypothetical protein